MAPAQRSNCINIFCFPSLLLFIHSFMLRHMLLSEYIQSSLLPDSPSIPQNLVLFWMETLVIHRISHNILAVCGFCMDFMLVKITETSPVAATLMNTLNCRTILFHKLQTLWWQYNRSNWAQFSTIPRLHPFNLIRNFFWGFGSLYDFQTVQSNYVDFLWL